MGGGGQLHSQKDKSKTSLDLSLILNSHSPLFQPIDTLTQALFDTNACPYLPKLYGIYKNTQEIDFSKLPKSFVLKTNHDCGGVILVPNKDIFLTNSKTFQESMDKLTQHLHTNYYLLHREWHYKDIEPRVFVEEILGEIEGEEWKAPTDYKIHCFKDCAYMQIDIDRFTNHTRVIFDEDWNPMPFSFLYPISQSIPNKPYNAEMMFAIAKALAGRFYMRVDLYNIYGRIVVGELTFTHGGGTETFNPKEWDKKFGDLWI
ncbi:ATP-grasp fold amidoligase family protein [Helicobacter japonicus]|uniref:ATP-grasp fold amidoligase family protein n=1 Tax=Helicobacter japonicus TaxID=425400 RepID=UPI00333AAB0F